MVQKKATKKKIISKKANKRSSTKTTSKKNPTKRTILSYESEFKKLKTNLETANFEQVTIFFHNLQKESKKFLSKTDKPQFNLIFKTLEFQISAKFNKIKKATELLKELDYIFSSKVDKDSLMYIDFNLSKADVYWKIGKQEEALAILQNLEQRFANQTLSNEILERIGDLFNTKGIIYWLLGEVQESQDSFQHFLTIMGRVGNRAKFTDALNNLGNVAAYKGELKEALDLHLQALESRMALGLKNQIASSLGNIGEIYHYMGEYRKSLENYLQAKELFEEIQNTLFQAKIYYQLIQLNLEYDITDEALKELQLLKALANANSSNEYVQVLYTYSQALLYKKSERLLDNFHAAVIFNEIAKTEKVIDNEITVQAVLNLTELLIFEMRLSNNETILTDIQNYCRRVSQIANNQNSSVLFVQSYLLESKLKLLDYKITDGKVALAKAIFIAQQHGLRRFEFLASQELDKLLQSEEKWEELKERHAPLKDRLDLTGFEETLTSLTKKKEEKIDIEREEPVLFIVLQKNGLPAFSFNFNKEIHMDNQLIGGFISAVNTFGRELFATEGQVERIKHGEFTLISKAVLENFTFCYAFKGPSFLATKKFDELIVKFLEDPIKNIFLTNLKSGYILEDVDEEKMKNLVKKCIFLSEEKENEILLLNK